MLTWRAHCLVYYVGSWSLSLSIFFSSLQHKFIMSRNEMIEKRKKKEKKRNKKMIYLYKARKGNARMKSEGRKFFVLLFYCALIELKPLNVFFFFFRIFLHLTFKTVCTVTWNCIRWNLYNKKKYKCFDVGVRRRINIITITMAEMTTAK